MKDLDEIFKGNLPDSMYMSHYQLAQFYGHTPQEWRKYLRDNNMFIESELAAIAEAEARAALAKLSNASGTEVQALKAVLEKSKLINDAQRQNTKVILTFVPDAWKTETVKEKVTEQTPEQQALVHKPEPEPDPIPQKKEELPDIDPYELF